MKGRWGDNEGKGKAHLSLSLPLILHHTYTHTMVTKHETGQDMCMHTNALSYTLSSWYMENRRRSRTLSQVDAW